ncbi:CapA family protein [Nonomuraea muscovyensis]|uniref:Poly-gamma-glutamate synthesis protein (Capsule biosynthesis protein) n=1 Tax=Nonomuraea muscovyensis TaxID=1124761 RepID=A0A7X0F0Y8_9ACTN|nr:CapA family protein [Nonomuraea muscovyensis]MBB6348156.1 poly-gamma-glutamate synthesis protein (capsule biosynthesis protein) [Nonomuraea muscovyensis]
MTITLALAGDTMLGRGVAERLTGRPRAEDFFAGEVREPLAEADLFLLNLECCVSSRGTPWRAPVKPFHFRAPPQAAGLLAELGVGCVTLANNHALDYGFEALLDTLGHLARAGIGCVGAGEDLAAARRPACLDVRGTRVGVVAFSDHPRDFAATPRRPGIAYADLAGGVPSWVTATVAALRGRGEAVLVTPHWGPNMVTEPLAYVRRAAGALVGAGATLVAGHSAHTFHGVAPRVLFDLGDFIDDYAVDPLARNDLGLLWLVTLSPAGPVELRALPLKLDYTRTRLARGDDWRRVRDRFTAAGAALGTSVRVRDGELVAALDTPCGG